MYIYDNISPNFS